MTIVVASGKGGTGKTTVSVGLARSLPGGVTLLDCDVEAPNTGLLLNEATGEGRCGIVTTETRFAIPVPRVNDSICTGCGACASFCRFGALAVVRKRVLLFEGLCHACGGCTRVCPVDAIEEAPHEIGTILETQMGALRHISGELDVGQSLAPPLIKEVKARGSKTRSAATTVIDAGPGTTCPVVEAARGSDVGLLVTENTPFGLHDLALAAEVFRDLKLPAGILINRSGMGCPDERELQQISTRFRYPVLMRIPFSEEVARAYAVGRPIVEPMPSLRSQFRMLRDALARLADVGPDLKASP